jgi:hypothetical protein
MSSHQKRLERAIRNNRVVAIPSKKKEVFQKDANGETIKDKNGEPITEKIQLYNIYKMN